MAEGTHAKVWIRSTLNRVGSKLKAEGTLWKSRTFITRAWIRSKFQWLGYA